MVSLSNSFVHNDDERDLEELKTSILAVLESVGMNTAASDEGVIRLAPQSNTWSRQARRAAQRAAQGVAELASADGGNADSTSEAAPATEGEPLFRARLTFSTPQASDSAEGGIDAAPKARAVLDWDWGRDRTTVDAFWKFVITKAGLRKRRQPDDDSSKGKKDKPMPSEEQETNNPYLQHQGNPYLAFSGGGQDRGRGQGRGRGGGRGFGRGHGRGGFSRPQDQGWNGRQ